MKYLVFDIETTIRSQFKRKASPFGKINKIVASGWKRAGMEKAAGEYFGREPPPKDWFTKLLVGTKLVVGSNLKFDILHAINQDPDNYTAWVEYVADGGRIYDIQYAEYLLQGMGREHQWLSLDEMAPRYGGHTKNDAVKALWEAGVDTTEIDRDMLMDYLVGAEGDVKDKGDIGNTELVFLGQLDALRARGSLQSVMLNMDSLIASIEMEHNGMYVNKPLGLKIAAELAIEVEKLKQAMNLSLPADLPFEFKWSSRFQVSAIVFGGKIKYKAKANIKDEHGNDTFYMKDTVQYVLADGDTTHLKPGDKDAPELGQYVTYKAGKNAGEFKTKKVKSVDLERGAKQRYEDFYYEFPGYTTPLPEWKTATEGVYSTSAAVIEALAGTGIPFLEALSAMAAMQKDLGTYYIMTDEDTGESTGMLTLVGLDGIIHHSINHVSTVTGRFSSSDPNLQNVSGGQKSDVKSIFESRFGDMGVIIQSDFTSLEVYVQAILTKCKQLIEDLKAGLDMHCVRVSQSEGVPYEYVLERARDEKHPEHKVWHYKRKNAKVFSFQRAYGAGVAKIAKFTGMTEEAVQALVDAENERYPEVDQFYELLTEAIKENRVPTQRFVPHPDIPGAICQLGRSHYFTPDRKMYSYSENPAPEWIAKKPASKGGVLQSFSPTEIKNYIVQGGGAEWAKAAMKLAVVMFYRYKNFGQQALLVNQVHDALYLDAHVDVQLRAAALLHACMEEASVYMEYTFQWEVPVPVPTETKWGKSMIEENDMPEGFKQQAAAFRKQIRDELMGSYVASYERGVN